MTSTERSPTARRNEGARAARKSPTAYRTISEVSDELDIPQHVLRFWETKFSQVKPLKRGGGRRYYRPEDITLLRRIQALLYREGYTIKGVQKLLREGRAAERAQAILKDETDAGSQIEATSAEAEPIDEGSDDASAEDIDGGRDGDEQAGDPSFRHFEAPEGALDIDEGQEDPDGRRETDFGVALTSEEKISRAGPDRDEAVSEGAASEAGGSLAPAVAAELSAVLDMLLDIRRQLESGLNEAPQMKTKRPEIDEQPDQ